MNPPLKEQMKEKKQQHQELIPKKHRQKPKKFKSEYLSESDIKSLMGIN